VNDRVVDLPLESLPFVDEHSVVVASTPDEVWTALVETVSGSKRAGPVARALGCEQTVSSGRPGRIGSTIPGFVITRSVRPAVLALMGAHRFSHYALVFQITETPLDPVILRAQTRADFPGRKGSLYRMAVIGTRGHVLAVEAMLHTIRRRAERAAEASGSLTASGS
jgi:hypothetical protein